MDEEQSKPIEVSLPGAGGSEPTIIETINKKQIANKSNNDEIKQTASDKIEKTQQINESESSLDEKLSEINVPDKTESQTETKLNEPEIESKETISDNILDIQSHLIETFDNNFSITENLDKSGVAIKEIPAQPEEFQRTSQIETETSPKTVIEIEPSIPIIHKSIQLDLDLSSNKRESKLINSFDEEIDQNISLNTDDINNNISNVKTENQKTIDKELDTIAKEEVKIDICNKFIENEKDKIESSHIENENLLANQINNENIKSDENSNKFEEIKNISEKLIEAEITAATVEDKIKVEIKETESEQICIKDTNELKPKTEIEINIEISEDSKEEQKNNDTNELTPKTEIEINTEINENSKEEEKNSIEETEIKRISLEKKPEVELEKKLIIINNNDHSNINSNNNLGIDIGINGLVNCTTPLEEEEKKKLLDSIPQLDADIDPYKLSIEAKKEYYQSLRDYLDKYQNDKPPVPLQTYRWEDVRRAKEKGGYPWTYLYKRPLGPDEEPEIVLLLRKSQEFSFHKIDIHNNHQTSESPKSLKKVRIDDQVLVKETERYISDLSDTEELSSSKASSPSSIAVSTESEEENRSLLSESCASDSVSEGKKSKFNKLKGILKRKTAGEKKKKSQDKKKKLLNQVKESTESKETATLSSVSSSPSPLPSDLPDSIISDDNLIPATTTESEAQSETDSRSTKVEEPSPKKAKCCHPIMEKIKTMADKQFKKRNIKKIPLKVDEKIVLQEEQKILKLRESPKADRSEIPKFVEKQDSEDVVEIVQLEESPSSKRKDTQEGGSILVPDEIIELPTQSTIKVQISQEKQIAEAIASEKQTVPVIAEPNASEKQTVSVIAEPNVSEKQTVPVIAEPNVSEKQTVADVPDSPPKKTLRKAKEHVYEEIDSNAELSLRIDEILELASVEALKQSLAAQDQSIIKDIEVNKKMILDRMGSSEEDMEKNPSVQKMSTLAPISSIDSTSSDEQEKRISLSTVAEESDAASVDDKHTDETPADSIKVIEEEKDFELKPALKKEPSPGPNGVDKKVTFSYVEDESEPLREDIEVPEELKNVPNRWQNMA